MITPLFCCLSTVADQINSHYDYEPDPRDLEPSVEDKIAAYELKNLRDDIYGPTDPNANLQYDYQDGDPAYDPWDY